MTTKITWISMDTTKTFVDDDVKDDDDDDEDDDEDDDQYERDVCACVAHDSVTSVYEFDMPTTSLFWQQGRERARESKRERE